MNLFYPKNENRSQGDIDVIIGVESLPDKRMRVQ
jgi:hypothetical protein